MHTYAKAEAQHFVEWLQASRVKDNGLKQRRFHFFDTDHNGQMDVPELELAIAQWRLETGAVPFKIFPEQLDPPTPLVSPEPSEMEWEEEEGTGEGVSWALTLSLRGDLEDTTATIRKGFYHSSTFARCCSLHVGAQLPLDGENITKLARLSANGGGLLHLATYPRDPTKGVVAYLAAKKVAVVCQPVPGLVVHLVHPSALRDCGVPEVLDEMGLPNENGLAGGIQDERSLTLLGFVHVRPVEAGERVNFLKDTVPTAMTMLRYRPGEEAAEEDFEGHIERAEKILFTKLGEYIRKKNPIALFREIDKKCDGKIDLPEWIWGMKSIINSKASDAMLTRIFRRMDLGDDHLGASSSDDSLTYKEWIGTMRWYMKHEYDGIHPRMQEGKRAAVRCLNRTDKNDIIRSQASETAQSAGRGDDDFGGDVEKAEKRLFNKLINYSGRSNVPSLFKDFDKKGDHKLDPEEWMYGCQELIKSKCSSGMLLQIFDRMDLGDDHLGKVTSDKELSYKEFQSRMDLYQVPAVLTLF